LRCFIVRNLRQENDLSYLPGKLKEKKIGHPSSKYMARKMIIHRGNKRINPRRERKMSKDLLGKSPLSRP
jgi:hypothetical protein